MKPHTENDTIKGGAPAFHSIFRSEGGRYFTKYRIYTNYEEEIRCIYEKSTCSER